MCSLLNLLLMRNRGAVRQLSVLKALRASGAVGVSFEELAQRFGVNQRTIRRDLELLEECHVPIIETDALGGLQHKRYGLMTGAPCPVCGKDGRVSA